MSKTEIEARLSQPKSIEDMYSWAILCELRALRQALAPEKPTTETVELREPKRRKTK